MNSPMDRRGFLKQSILAAAAFSATGRKATAASPAATLLRYPYLQNLRSDRATIVWATLGRGNGLARYSADYTLSKIAAASVREFLPSQTGLSYAFYQYQAELTGLSAATDYFYLIAVDGEELAPEDALQFRTPGHNPFNFLVLGDSGQGSREQRFVAIRMLMEAPTPELVLHTGDIAYPSGTFSQFDRHYFPYYQDLMKRAPMYPTAGNHDYETQSAAAYLALHAVPAEGVATADRGRYYSFDWANAHFVVLDSNLLLADPVAGTGRMLEWLENDLRKSRRFWRVACFHHPPYASGFNEGDPISELVRAKVVPILERHGVPLVLNGHEHSYQRTYPLQGGTVVQEGRGTVYITSGGGGARLYPVFPRAFHAAGESVHHFLRGEVRGMRMTLTAIGIDGREIDSVTVAPAPLISGDSTVNAASYSPSVAPGSLVAIFGRHLAGAEAHAAELPLPRELSGTTVTLNGHPVPLLYVSRDQVNAQLPFDVQGQGILRVTTPNDSTESIITISDAAPGIFFVAGDPGALPAITNASGVAVSPDAPVQAGEHITVYLTGLGAVNGAIEAGQAAPFSPLLTARLPVRVELGNTVLVPSYAGLSPGFAGLYQVDVQVPANFPSGTYTLRIVAGTGSRSNAVSLTVQSAASGKLGGLIE